MVLLLFIELLKEAHVMCQEAMAKLSGKIYPNKSAP